FEKIVAWELLPNEFTLETGEITPTLKVKRRVINQKYGSIIDRLYAEADKHGGERVGSIFHLEVGADRLATLTFDSPDRKVNVFTRAAFQELEQLVDALAARKDIGCLILLSGKPGNFIAGADVEEIARVTDPLEAEAGSRVGHRLFSAWEGLPFPT